MGIKIQTLRVYYDQGGQIYGLEEQIWPQEVISVEAWHELAESQEQTRRVGLGFSHSSLSEYLAELGECVKPVDPGSSI